MQHRLTSLLATDQEGQTALISAALEGDSKKVRVLLKLGADINTQDGMGRTALMLAVINRHVKIVKALLHNRADVNITTNDGDTALSLAASGGDGAMTKALLDHRAEVARNPLRQAQGWRQETDTQASLDYFRGSGHWHDDTRIDILRVKAPAMKAAAETEFGLQQRAASPADI